MKLTISTFHYLLSSKIIVSVDPVFKEVESESWDADIREESSKGAHGIDIDDSDEEIKDEGKEIVRSIPR
jgi:hypothetical protein